jgi:hypothetical protein
MHARRIARIAVAALVLPGSVVACSEPTTPIADALKYPDVTGTYELSLTYLADSSVAKICRVEIDLEEQRTEDSEFLPYQVCSGTYSIQASRKCSAKSGTFKGSGNCAGTWCGFHLTVDLYDFGGECEAVSATGDFVNIHIENARIKLWGGWTNVRCGTVETSWEIQGTGTRI